MVNVDWSPEGGGDGDRTRIDKAGTYRAKVIKAEAKTSKAGNAMLVVDYAAPAFEGAYLCRDWLVLTGKGRGYGTAKLTSLGIAPGTGELEPDALVGAEVFLAVYEDEYDGKVYLKVDQDAQGSSFGYFVENPGFVDEGAPAPQNPAPATPAPSSSGGAWGGDVSADDTPF
jgi:hypothetical protein